MKAFNEASHNPGIEMINRVSYFIVGGRLAVVFLAPQMEFH